MKIIFVLVFWLAFVANAPAQMTAARSAAIAETGFSKGPIGYFAVSSVSVVMFLSLRYLGGTVKVRSHCLR